MMMMTFCTRGAAVEIDALAADDADQQLWHPRTP